MSARRSLSNSLAEVASPRSTMANTRVNHKDSAMLDVDSNATKAKTQRLSSKRNDSATAWEVQIARLLPRPPTKEGKAVITCLDFGINRGERDAKYPDAFFCGNCIFFVDDYGIAPAARRKKMFPNGSRYKCTAKHPSLEEPASKTLHFSLRGRSVDEDKDYDKDDASRDF